MPRTATEPKQTLIARANCPTQQTQTIIVRRWTNADGHACVLCPLAACTFAEGTDGQGACIVSIPFHVKRSEAALFSTHGLAGRN